MSRSIASVTVVDLSQAGQSRFFALDLVMGPARGVRKADGVDLSGQIPEFLPAALRRPEQLVDGQPEGVPDPAAHELGVSCQLCLLALQDGEFCLELRRCGKALLDPGLDVLKKLLLLRLVGVEFQTEMPKAGMVQAVPDDLKGCQLLRDEENLLSLGDCRCDDVGDGLGLSGARRAVDDQVLAGEDIYDRTVLRGVRVVDQRLRGFRPLVDLVVLRMERAVALGRSAGED